MGRVASEIAKVAQMKAFLTGANGFVGNWLSRHLDACGDEVVPAPEGFDVTDPESVRRAVIDAQPDVLFHLAAQSHVGESWKNPARTFAVNATGTLHVLDAALACDEPPRVLVISSSEVYGNVKEADLPLTESSPLAPVTPYASSKVAGEYLGLQAYLGTKLPVIRTRSFNHVGPGQAPNFLVSALAQRIVKAEREGQTTLAVGNLEARRDYTDVRDVVRAYRLLAEKGTPGAVYNVCSGSDMAVSAVADRLLALSSAKLQLTVDPDLVRPVELPALRGDNSSLRQATGWSPEITLDQTLADVLRYWREQS